MSHQYKLLIAAFVTSTPLLVHAAAGEYAFFTDRDTGGGALYGGAPVWVKNSGQCAAACTADPNCFGWTLSMPDNPTWDAPCYLKGTDNCDYGTFVKSQKSGKYYSGIIGSGCSVQCKQNRIVVENCQVVTPIPTSTKAAGRYRRDTAQREANARQASLCPGKETACPIAGDSPVSGYECVDIMQELSSCGACGNDCTSIPGVDGVTCNQGKCIVSSCAPGYSLGILGECRKAPVLAHRRSTRAHGRRLTSHI